MNHRAFSHPWLYTLLATATLAGWNGISLAQESAPASPPPPAQAAVATNEGATIAKEAPAPAEMETAPAETEAAPAEDEAAPAEVEVEEVEETVETPYWPRGYRGYDDRYRALMRARIEARREALERYRSARRWWNNPDAEARRLWSQARSDWYREQALRHRAYRPDYNYGYEYGYGPGYRYGRGYGTLPPWVGAGPAEPTEPAEAVK